MSLKCGSGALLSCLGLGSAAFAQAAEPGWYLIGSGGESSLAGDNQRQIDDNFVAIVASVGLEVVDASSTLDDSDTGFGLAGGFQFNDHFAVEFGYIDLGSVDYRAVAVVSDGVNQGDASVRLGSSARGAVVSALGIFPVGERFSLFGRAGLSMMSADGTARVTVDDLVQRASQSSQKFDPVLGIGAELDVGRHFTVRLAWDRHFDVGTADVTGDVDADLITLGFRIGADWFD